MDRLLVSQIANRSVVQNLVGPLLGLGRLWYVNSAAAGANNGSPSGNTPGTPFATLVYAVTQAAAYDTIVVAASHAESIDANDLTLSKDGLQIIGVGEGDARPLFTLAATGSTIAVSGAGVLLQNVRLTTDVDNVTVGITVTGAGFSLVDCRFTDKAATQIATFLTASAAANRLTVRGLRYLGDASDGTLAAFALTGCADVLIEDFHIDGNFSVGVVNCLTTAVPRLTVRRGYARTRNIADIIVVDTITGSTGVIGPDLSLSLQDNAANITQSITGATFRVIDPVYVVNLDNEKAMLINWTPSTHA